MAWTQTWGCCAATSLWGCSTLSWPPSRLRVRSGAAPVLLTARDAEEVRVFGLEPSVDHYSFNRAVAGTVGRLQPSVIITVLTAGLGLLAALLHGVDSKTQRPFAIRIVGGIVSAPFYLVAAAASVWLL